MKRVLIVLLLGAGGWAVYAHCLAGARPLDVLTKVPDPADATGVAGVVEVEGLDGAFAPAEGRHTILVIHDPQCPACRILEMHLRQLQVLRPDVAVRKLRWSAAVAETFNVSAVPHVLIYDAKGNLLAEDARDSRAGTELLAAWLSTERRRL